jgi:hypothetical protein
MARFTVKRAVQIDDVKFASSLLRPVAGLSRRIVSVYRNIVGATLAETNAHSAFKIDSGKYYHITPFDEGTPFSAGSNALAERSARAKLLKKPSHT